MRQSLPDRVARTHVKSFHADSHAIHGDSQPVRIAVKDAYLAALNETRTRLNRSVEDMAAKADCQVSAMSDALAGKRNFAGHWLLAQGDDFCDMFNRIVDDRRGTSVKAKHARIGRELGEMVRRIVEALAS